MFDAEIGFRRIWAYKQLTILKKAFFKNRQKGKFDQIKDAALCLIKQHRLSEFQ